MAQPLPPDRPSGYAPHEAAQVRPRRPWGAAAIGLVVGLIVATAVGGVLVATKRITLGSGEKSGIPVSATPITLPSTLAGFQDLIEATKAASKASTRSATIVAAQQVNQQKVLAATVAAYQRANPGAAVDYRAYGDPGLLHFVNVIAVRAQHAGVTIGPVSDPSYQGVAVATQQVKTFGDVQCIVVQSQVTPAGKPVDPALDLTTMCQRSGPLLTVQVYGTAFGGADGQQMIVGLTNDAWTAISG